MVSEQNEPVSPRRVTAADVAAAAGVSRTTVSYVLNERPHQSIPTATRERVLAAARELGYTPSAAARTLATGRSDLVLGIVPAWPIGPNAGELLRRMTEALAARGLTYVSHIAGNPGEDFRTVSPPWQSLSPAAVLIFEDLDAGEVERIRTSGVATVLLIWSSTGSGLDEVAMWDQHVGRLQVERLVSAGHRRLGYAWPDDQRLRSFAVPRLEGVRSACAEHGLGEPIVQTVPLDADGAAAAIERFRRAVPAATGICAYNDEVAVALLAGLRRLGLTTPSDLAVVGVDDIPTAALTDPPLTTINYDRTALADHLATLVVNAIGGDPRADEPDFPAFIRLVDRGTV